MKKLFAVLFLSLVLVLSVSPVLAEVIERSALPTDPFSWEYLATITGATMGTLMIVQLLKLPLDRVWKIPTRILVYVIALILLLLATGFTMGLDWNTGLLTAINAVIVALAAMGAYEVTFANQDHNS
jgi:cell division protein FtsW (lipid II flippase)